METSINHQKRVPVFEYYHLLLFFHSEDYRPIAIYGAFGDKMMRAEIGFSHGVFNSIHTETVEGFDSLDEEDAHRFELIIDLYLSDIVRAWTDFFVYRKEVSNEIIRRRIN
jgi:hypothetical protein